MDSWMGRASPESRVPGVTRRTGASTHAARRARLLAAVAANKLFLRCLGLVVLRLLDHLQEVGVDLAQQLLLLLLVLEGLLLAPHLALARLEVLLALHLALE